jgi:hypothetical protein
MGELETRIAHWPEKWGDDLQVMIYGDFDAPDHDLDYATLGITVEAGNKRTNTINMSARCVVSARVKVREKNVSAVLDAAARLNTFLGIWTMIDWGNRGVGWWCSLTGGTRGFVGGPFKKEGIEDALAGIERLPQKVKRKVRAALYWIREPKRMMLETFKNDILPVYAGYWNAFECLVDAVCLIRPHRKMVPVYRDLSF